MNDAKIEFHAVLAAEAATFRALTALTPTVLVTGDTAFQASVDNTAAKAPTPVKFTLDGTSLLPVGTYFVSQISDGAKAIRMVIPSGQRIGGTPSGGLSNYVVELDLDAGTFLRKPKGGSADTTTIYDVTSWFSGETGKWQLLPQSNVIQWDNPSGAAAAGLSAAFQFKPALYAP